jgi:hypothetical protein
MFRFLTVILIVLWLCVAVIIGINLYRQFEVGKLQTRILQDYKQMSEVPDFFKSVQDSLALDVAAAEKLTGELIKPFPLKSLYWNWLLMRLSVIILTLVSIGAYWYYYKRHTPV